jgi:hypothetical protein
VVHGSELYGTSILCTEASWGLLSSEERSQTLLTYLVALPGSGRPERVWLVHFQSCRGLPGCGPLSGLRVAFQPLFWDPFWVSKQCLKVIPVLTSTHTKGNSVILDLPFSDPFPPTGLRAHTSPVCL